MKKVILILGDIFETESLATVNEVQGILFCEDIDQAKIIGREFMAGEIYSNYIIPANEKREILFNCIHDFDLSTLPNVTTSNNKILEKLGEFISAEVCDLQDELDRLISAQSHNGNAMADTVVFIWEPFEYTLTINQLLETIGYSK
jgi:hypothetical protein